MTATATAEYGPEGSLGPRVWFHEALPAFNNSQDVGFTQTPAPFDRPLVDDYGNVSGADPSRFTKAQGNSTPHVMRDTTK